MEPWLRSCLGYWLGSFYRSWFDCSLVSFLDPCSEPGLLNAWILLWIQAPTLVVDLAYILDPSSDPGFVTGLHPFLDPSRDHTYFNGLKVSGSWHGNWA